MTAYRHKGVTVSVDARDPNIMYLDRDAETVLVQVDPDVYRIEKGRCVLGTVSYERGVRSGWRFAPRGSNRKASRRLHPYPEAALGRRFSVQRVESLRTIPA